MPVIIFIPWFGREKGRGIHQIAPASHKPPLPISHVCAWGIGGAGLSQQHDSAGRSLVRRAASRREQPLPPFLLRRPWLAPSVPAARPWPRASATWTWAHDLTGGAGPHRGRARPRRGLRPWPRAGATSRAEVGGGGGAWQTTARARGGRDLVWGSRPGRGRGLTGRRVAMVAATHSHTRDGAVKSSGKEVGDEGNLNIFLTFSLVETENK